MSMLSTQRDQVKRVLVEIESLRADLRDDPDEFVAEMHGLIAWCELLARRAKRRET